MSPETLRIILGVLFIGHGLGHIMGIMPALRLFTTEGWSSHSWLLTKPLGDTAARIISIILFLIVVLGSVGAGLALLGWLMPYAWWRLLAITSSVVSLVAITLYWNAFIALFPHKIAAIALDLATLAALLVANWPTDADLGL